MLIPSLRQLPVGINGICLCTCGVAILLRVFIPLYSDSNANEIIILLLSISLALATLYILKCIFFLKEALQSDWNLPIQINGIGSLSIALTVQGSLFYDPLGEPSLSLYWLLLATAFIAYVNIIFLRSCIINNVPPEPIYNTSIFNVFFVPALLPSDPSYCVIIRDIFFVYGLIMAAFVVPTSMYRILFLKDEDHATPCVARNPTCAIQQAALSICCTAWLQHPISFSGVDVQQNQGLEVLHLFFALSQVGYIVTIISIWQRRSILQATGYHPSWAAFTFPFANTAITTCLYRRTFPKLGVWLDLLVFYHVIVALLLCGTITAMYVGKGLFMFPAAIPPESRLKDDSGVVVFEKADDNDNDNSSEVDDDPDVEEAEAVEVDLDVSERTPCVDIGAT